jgi:hypothetical protein
MNQQWKHAPSEASQVIHRFILRNQELCKHQWRKGPVLNKIRSSEDLPKRQEEMVFYNTNLSQICHQISLVTTFSRTLQRLGFKVDNGQENTTVLKRIETKRQVITTTITKRKYRHSRATQEHPDMKGKNIRAYSYHKKTWEFGARKIEELGCGSAVANEREMKLERGERQGAESAAMTEEWREGTRVASKTVGD